MAAERSTPFGLVLALLSFTGAFLLFVVQPLLAKWLLPALGGSPGTWAACMLFFQATLLVGYGFVHWQAATAAPQSLARWAHPLLSAAAAAAIVLARTLPGPHVRLDAPVRSVLFALTAQVGAAFLLLSTVSPIAQRWAAERQGRDAYRLYALSNAGSLAGLLAYPFLIEPAWPLDLQWRLWSCAALATACVSCALGVRASRVRTDSSASELAAAAELPQRARPFAWIAHAFVPSMLLLASTNYLTTDLAAAPLLWVVPLAVYLATFIVAFAGAGRRAFRLALAVFLPSSLGIGWNALSQGSAPLWRQLTVSLAVLASAALLCHVQLARLRPPVRALTGYYVCIALGGALGALFVALLSPSLFDDYYELELAIVATYVVLLARPSAGRGRADAGVTAPGDPSFATRLRRPLEQSAVRLGAALCLPLLLGSVWLRAGGATHEGRVLERRRSLLGAVRVTQLSVGRVLTHGRIRHGMQLDDPALRRAATMYYGPGTALAQVFARQRAGDAREIGVIGLGAGTIAALGAARDRIRFYELDEHVIELASRHFTFLRDSPARIEVAHGDGRLLLARERASRFDLLVLDAFASDAVPVHLLTQEAFGTYLTRLRDDGVLLANVANRHLAVDRVVRGAAEAHGLACMVVETLPDPQHYVSRVRWAIAAREERHLHALLRGMNAAAPGLPTALWTDAHASLWPLVR